MAVIRPEWVAGEVLKELAAPAWTHGDTWCLYLSRKQALANMGVEALQNHREFAELIDLLRRDQVVNVIEIGCADGGWLGILAGCIGRPLNILAIDLDPNSHPAPGRCPVGYPRRLAEVVTMLRAEGHCVEHVARRSQDTDAIAAARVWVATHGLVDVLHIDGDHSFRGCLADYEGYRGLVRPGGVIVFYDTANPDEPDVEAVFKMIQKEGMTESVWQSRAIDERPKGRGIGVNRIPLSTAARRPA